MEDTVGASDKIISFKNGNESEQVPLISSTVHFSDAKNFQNGSFSSSSANVKPITADLIINRSDSDLHSCDVSNSVLKNSSQTHDGLSSFQNDGELVFNLVSRIKTDLGNDSLKFRSPIPKSGNNVKLINNLDSSFNAEVGVITNPPADGNVDFPTVLSRDVFTDQEANATADLPPVLSRVDFTDQEANDTDDFPPLLSRVDLTDQEASATADFPPVLSKTVFTDQEANVDFDPVFSRAVITDQETDCTIDNDPIFSRNVITDQEADGTLDVDQVLSRDVTTDQEADGTLDVDQVLSRDVTTDQEADGTLDVDQVLSRDVTTDQEADGTVDFGPVFSNVITDQETDCTFDFDYVLSRDVISDQETERTDDYSPIFSRDVFEAVEKRCSQNTVNCSLEKEFDLVLTITPSDENKNLVIGDEPTNIDETFSQDFPNVVSNCHGIAPHSSFKRGKLVSQKKFESESSYLKRSPSIPDVQAEKLSKYLNSRSFLDAENCMDVITSIAFDLQLFSDDDYAIEGMHTNTAENYNFQQNQEPTFNLVWQVISNIKSESDWSRSCCGSLKAGLESTNELSSTVQKCSCDFGGCSKIDRVRSQTSERVCNQKRRKSKLRPSKIQPGLEKDSFYFRAPVIQPSNSEKSGNHGKKVTFQRSEKLINVMNKNPALKSKKLSSKNKLKESSTLNSWNSSTQKENITNSNLKLRLKFDPKSKCFKTVTNSSFVKQHALDKKVNELITLDSEGLNEPIPSRSPSPLLVDLTTSNNNSEEIRIVQDVSITEVSKSIIESNSVVSKGVDKFAEDRNIQALTSSVEEVVQDVGSNSTSSIRSSVDDEMCNSKSSEVLSSDSTESNSNFKPTSIVQDSSTADLVTIGTSNLNQTDSKDVYEFEEEGSIETYARFISQKRLSTISCTAIASIKIFTLGLSSSSSVDVKTPNHNFSIPEIGVSNPLITGLNSNLERSSSNPTDKDLRSNHNVSHLETTQNLLLSENETTTKRDLYQIEQYSTNTSDVSPVSNQNLESSVLQTKSVPDLVTNISKSTVLTVIDQVADDLSRSSGTKVSSSNLNSNHLNPQVASMTAETNNSKTSNLVVLANNAETSFDSLNSTVIQEECLTDALKEATAETINVAALVLNDIPLSALSDDATPNNNLNNSVVSPKSNIKAPTNDSNSSTTNDSNSSTTNDSNSSTTIVPTDVPTSLVDASSISATAPNNNKNDSVIAEEYVTDAQTNNDHDYARVSYSEFNTFDTPANDVNLWNTSLEDSVIFPVVDDSNSSNILRKESVIETPANDVNELNSSQEDSVIFTSVDDSNSSYILREDTVIETPVNNSNKTNSSQEGPVMYTTTDNSNKLREEAIIDTANESDRCNILRDKSVFNNTTIINPRGAYQTVLGITEDSDDGSSIKAYANFIRQEIRKPTLSLTATTGSKYSCKAFLSRSSCLKSLKFGTTSKNLKNTNVEIPQKKSLAHVAANNKAKPLVSRAFVKKRCVQATIKINPSKNRESSLNSAKVIIGSAIKCASRMSKPFGSSATNVLTKSGTASRSKNTDNSTKNTFKNIIKSYKINEEKRCSVPSEKSDEKTSILNDCPSMLNFTPIISENKSKIIRQSSFPHLSFNSSNSDLNITFIPSNLVPEVKSSLMQSRVARNAVTLNVIIPKDVYQFVEKRFQYFTVHQKKESGSKTGSFHSRLSKSTPIKRLTSNETLNQVNSDQTRVNDKTSNDAISKNRTALMDISGLEKEKYRLPLYKTKVRRMNSKSTSRTSSVSNGEIFDSKSLNSLNIAKSNSNFEDTRMVQKDCKGDGSSRYSNILNARNSSNDVESTEVVDGLDEVLRETSFNFTSRRLRASISSVSTISAELDDELLNTGSSSPTNLSASTGSSDLNETNIFQEKLPDDTVSFNKGTLNAKNSSNAVELDKEEKKAESDEAKIKTCANFTPRSSRTSSLGSASTISAELDDEPSNTDLCNPSNSKASTSSNDLIDTSIFPEKVMNDTVNLSTGYLNAKNSSDVVKSTEEEEEISDEVARKTSSNFTSRGLRASSTSSASKRKVEVDDEPSNPNVPAREVELDDEPSNPNASTSSNDLNYTSVFHDKLMNDTATLNNVSLNARNSNSAVELEEEEEETEGNGVINKTSCNFKSRRSRASSLSLISTTSAELDKGPSNTESCSTSNPKASASSNNLIETSILLEKVKDANVTLYSGKFDANNTSNSIKVDDKRSQTSFKSQKVRTSSICSVSIVSATSKDETLNSRSFSQSFVDNISSRTNSFFTDRSVTEPKNADMPQNAVKLNAVIPNTDKFEEEDHEQNLRSKSKINSVFEEKPNSRPYTPLSLNFTMSKIDFNDTNSVLKPLNDDELLTAIKSIEMISNDVDAFKKDRNGSLCFTSTVNDVLEDGCNSKSYSTSCLNITMSVNDLNASSLKFVNSSNDNELLIAINSIEMISNDVDAFQKDRDGSLFLTSTMNDVLEDEYKSKSFSKNDLNDDNISVIKPLNDVGFLSAIKSNEITSNDVDTFEEKYHEGSSCSTSFLNVMTPDNNLNDVNITVTELLNDIEFQSTVTSNETLFNDVDKDGEDADNDMTSLLFESKVVQGGVFDSAATISDSLAGRPFCSLSCSPSFQNGSRSNNNLKESGIFHVGDVTTNDASNLNVDVSKYNDEVESEKVGSRSPSSSSLNATSSKIDGDDSDIVLESCSSLRPNSASLNYSLNGVDIFQAEYVNDTATNDGSNSDADISKYVQEIENEQFNSRSCSPLPFNVYNVYNVNITNDVDDNSTVSTLKSFSLPYLASPVKSFNNIMNNKTETVNDVETKDVFLLNKIISKYVEEEDKDFYSRPCSPSSVNATFLNEDTDDNSIEPNSTSLSCLFCSSPENNLNNIIKDQADFVNDVTTSDVFKLNSIISKYVDKEDDEDLHSRSCSPSSVNAAYLKEGTNDNSIDSRSCSLLFSNDTILNTYSNDVCIGQGERMNVVVSNDDSSSIEEKRKNNVNNCNYVNLNKIISKHVEEFRERYYSDTSSNYNVLKLFETKSSLASSTSFESQNESISRKSSKTKPVNIKAPFENFKSPSIVLDDVVTDVAYYEDVFLTEIDAKSISDSSYGHSLSTTDSFSMKLGSELSNFESFKSEASLKKTSDDQVVFCDIPDIGADIEVYSSFFPKGSEQTLSIKSQGNQDSVNLNTNSLIASSVTDGSSKNIMGTSIISEEDTHVTTNKRTSKIDSSDEIGSAEFIQSEEESFESVEIPASHESSDVESDFNRSNLSIRQLVESDLPEGQKQAVFVKEGFWKNVSGDARMNNSTFSSNFHERRSDRTSSFSPLDAKEPLNCVLSKMERRVNHSIEGGHKYETYSLSGSGALKTDKTKSVFLNGNVMSGLESTRSLKNGRKLRKENSSEMTVAKKDVFSNDLSYLCPFCKQVFPKICSLFEHAKQHYKTLKNVCPDYFYFVVRRESPGRTEKRIQCVTNIPKGNSVQFRPRTITKTAKVDCVTKFQQATYHTPQVAFISKEEHATANISEIINSIITEQVATHSKVDVVNVGQSAKTNYPEVDCVNTEQKSIHPKIDFVNMEKNVTPNIPKVDPMNTEQEATHPEVDSMNTEQEATHPEVDFDITGEHEKNNILEVDSVHSEQVVTHISEVYSVKMKQRTEVYIPKVDSSNTESCVAVDIPEVDSTNTVQQLTILNPGMEYLISEKQVTMHPPEINISKEGAFLYQCSVCDLSFKRQSFLKHHMVRHSEDRPHQCTICFSCFKRPGNLTMHMTSHNDVRPFQCSLCPAKFKFNYLLTSHMQSHDENHPHRCSICFLTFKTKFHLNHHITINHNDKRPYRCQICPCSFKSNDRLVGHMICHSQTEVQLYQCTLCCSKFETKEALDSHVCCDETRPHQHSSGIQLVERKPDLNLLTTSRKAGLYQCQLCPAKFKWKNGLDYHVPCHDETRSHVCTTCSKAFKRSVDLKIHVKIHDLNRPFKCHLCKAEFKLRRTITKHMRCCHDVNRPYHCPICSYTFDNTSCLDRHMLYHTEGRPYSCWLCPSKFRRKCYLNEHVRNKHNKARPFQCPTCPKTFRSNKDVKTHLCQVDTTLNTQVSAPLLDI